MAGRWVEDVGEGLTGVTSILTLGVGLLALFLGFEWFWMVFVLGWVVITPLVAILTGSRESERDDTWTDANPTHVSTDRESTSGSKEDALETLRSRYARGELSDAEFERKLEQLLRTETLEDARRTVESESPRATEDEREREPRGEREQAVESDRRQAGDPDR